LYIFFRAGRLFPTGFDNPQMLVLCIPAMCQKAVAAILICTWLILSGADLLEDLDLPDRTEFDDPAESEIPSNPFAGLLTRNIVESAAHEGIRFANLLGAVIAEIIVHKPHPTQSIAKLYKVFHVFII
jgi:hypothetical protein